MRQKIYKRWLIFSIILFIISTSSYIYFRFFHWHWLIFHSFMLIIMSLGWGGSAIAGIIDNKEYQYNIDKKKI